MRNLILQVGKIVNTHGLRGEVKAVCWTDSQEQFEELEYVYTDTKAGRIKLFIIGIKYQKSNVILQIKDVNTIEQAEGLKNSVLYVDREQLGEPKGHYICDLLGIKVSTVDGTYLGEITDVFSTGGNDVYVVKPPQGKDILLPVIDQVVKGIDIDACTATVELLEGLID